MNRTTAQPLVSVLMPAFNASAYIDEAIASVLSQTTASLELIVVDDGSTDDTYDRVLSWTARDRRVIPLRQENHGISAARNAALARSSGRFMALLDSDDAWEPGFLAAQLAVFESTPTASVVSGNVVHVGGSHDGELMWPQLDEPRVLHLRDLLADEMSICIMSVFRREVYEAIGGFDVTLRSNEDYQFWLRAALAGFEIVRSPVPLGRYRRRADSVSADQTIMLDGIVRVLGDVRDRCAGRDDLTAIIDRQLRRFERERLVLQGKVALLGGQFAFAAQAFDAARRLDRGWKLRAVGALCRRAPRLLRLAYRLRSPEARRAIVAAGSLA